jgi:hypothetical protein
MVPATGEIAALVNIAAFKPAGAAWTAFAEITAAIAPADNVNPRLEKNLRNFSSA